MKLGLVVLLTLPLAVCSFSAPSAANEPPAGNAYPADVQAVVDNAIASKTSLDVPSMEDEYSTTKANPDGSLTSTTSAAIQRVRDGAGWLPVNYDLEHVADGWAPKVSPHPLVFSDGGDKDAVSIGSGAANMSLSWDVTLPAPSINGPTATYDLGDGKSLVLTAIEGGFEQSIVLDAPPTSIPSIKLPFDTSDLTLQSDGHGTFSFTNNSGDTVYTIPQPLMYGAAKDPSSDLPLQSAPVSATVVHTAAGDRLDLAPSLTWLSAPTTTYPVTIDPVISYVDNGDTYVRDDLTTPVPHTWEMQVGHYQNHAERAYMAFPTVDNAMQHDFVTSATLKIWNTSANSCTAGTVTAYPLRQAVNLNTVTWSSKPPLNTSDPLKGTGSFAHGIEGSCANDYGSIDVTNIVKAWAVSPQSPSYLANNGIQLAGAETSGAQGWQFCSYNVTTANSCNTADHSPTITINYTNTYPAVATGIVTSNGTAVANATALLYLEDTSAAADAMPDNTTEPLELVGATRSKADGSFEIDLDPDSVPSSYVSDAQLVNFSLVVANSTQELDWDFTAQEPLDPTKPWTADGGTLGDTVVQDMKFDLGNGTAYETSEDPASFVDDSNNAAGSSARTVPLQSLDDSTVDAQTELANQQYAAPQYASTSSKESMAAPVQSASSDCDWEYAGHVVGIETFLKIWTWNDNAYGAPFKGAYGTVSESASGTHTLGVGIGAGLGPVSLNGSVTLNEGKTLIEGASRYENQTVTNRVNYALTEKWCGGDARHRRITKRKLKSTSFFDFLTNDSKGAGNEAFPTCSPKAATATFTTESHKNVTYKVGVSISSPIINASLSAQSGYSHGANEKISFTEDGWICGTSNYGPLYSAQVDAQPNKT